MMMEATLSTKFVGLDTESDMKSSYGREMRACEQLAQSQADSSMRYTARSQSGWKQEGDKGRCKVVG